MLKDITNSDRKAACLCWGRNQCISPLPLPSDRHLATAYHSTTMYIHRTSHWNPIHACVQSDRVPGFCRHLHVRAVRCNPSGAGSGPVQMSFPDRYIFSRGTCLQTRTHAHGLTTTRNLYYPPHSYLCCETTVSSSVGVKKRYWRSCDCTGNSVQQHINLQDVQMHMP